MRFMNEYEIDEAVSRHIRNTHPNRLAAALVLANLRDWANHHSDGWAYWPKPARSAAQLMVLAEPMRAEHDVTDEELALAARPVRAFLTRSARLADGRFPGRSLVTPGEREVILRALEG